MSGTVIDTEDIKSFFSRDYNYTFNKINGEFNRWGKTMNDDPDMSPYGPEIADIEISTICHKNCKFCYKQNSNIGSYMPFNMFTKIFDKLPNTITQIAFGIGDIDVNPDTYRIMKYCRDNGVIPNITINGSRMTEYDYTMLSGLCGSVAVSLYDYTECFNAVKTLRKNGMKQVNIHALISKETFDQCMSTITSWETGELNNYVNAIVFLMLKPVGKGKALHSITNDQFKELINGIKKHKVRAGFDSCSAPHVMKYLPEQEQYIESCESTLFSIYVNVNGEAYPCSFSEDTINPINLLEVNDFNAEVWNNPTFKTFRRLLIETKDKKGCRACPLFKLM